MDHLSLVGIVPWEFVAQIANLLIQAALFKKFLFKPVQGIIAKRRGEVNAIYGEAEAARTAAEEEKAEYDRLMRDARVEAGQIVKAAAENAEARATQLIQSAQQEAAGSRKRPMPKSTGKRKKQSMRSRITSPAWSSPWRKRSWKRRSTPAISRRSLISL